MSVLHSFRSINVLTVIGKAAFRHRIPVLLRDIGIANITETESVDHAILQLRHARTAHSLVVCDKLGCAGYLPLLRFIRWEKTSIPPSLPVICVAEEWGDDEVITARDARVTATLSMPTTMHGLQAAVAMAISGERGFVTSPAFRGVERRRNVAGAGHAGPFRRATDDTFRQNPAVAPVAPIAAATPAGGAGKSFAAVGQGGASSPAQERDPHFVWSKAIETGREDVDNEHRKIFDILNKLKDVSRAPVTKTAALEDVFAMLKDYVNAHFAHEEQLMDSFRYDDREIHKKLHAAFANRIEQISQGSFSDKVALQKLFLVVYNWLMSHIADIDRVMIAKLNGQYDKEFTELCSSHHPRHLDSLTLPSEND